MGSQMIMMLLIFATMFVMFNEDLRNSVGRIAGIVLIPLIGFGGHYPVITIASAGIILVTFSSGVRHYFINWIDTAEKQFKMKDFNKKLRDARMSGKDEEVKKLTEKQLDMSKDQMNTMIDQMKPMMFTMIFLIGTFAFIGTFVQDIPGATLSVPWRENVLMNSSINLGACCIFSNWMLLYMLVSMSTAQVIQRVFKLYSFSRMLKDPEFLAGKREPEPKAKEPATDDSEPDAPEEKEYLVIDDEQKGLEPERVGEGEGK